MCAKTLPTKFFRRTKFLVWLIVFPLRSFDLTLEHWINLLAEADVVRILFVVLVQVCESIFGQKETDHVLKCSRSH
jgi:hypothetical protein